MRMNLESWEQMTDVQERERAHVLEPATYLQRRPLTSRLVPNLRTGTFIPFPPSAPLVEASIHFDDCKQASLGRLCQARQQTVVPPAQQCLSACLPSKRHGALGAKRSAGGR